LINTVLPLPPPHKNIGQCLLEGKIVKSYESSMRKRKGNMERKIESNRENTLRYVYAEDEKITEKGRLKVY
jgi:hypothetical protein